MRARHLTFDRMSARYQSVLKPLAPPSLLGTWNVRRETCAIPSPGVRGLLASAVISDTGYLPPLLHSGATSRCRCTAGPQRCTRHMHASPSALAAQQEGSKVMTAAPLVRGWWGVWGIQFPEAVYWKKKWSPNDRRHMNDWCFWFGNVCVFAAHSWPSAVGFIHLFFFFIFNYALRCKQSSGSYAAFKDSHVTASAIDFAWL